MTDDLEPVNEMDLAAAGDSEQVYGLQVGTPHEPAGDVVDEASIESFPASDPPAWAIGVASHRARRSARPAPAVD